MKKFLQRDITSESNEYEPMMMEMLGNSTSAAGGSSDDCDDRDNYDASHPADSLAFNNMLLHRDGTVMTEATIRELRFKQGYCLTCPGDPIKLFAIKRSKMNPLYQKKEPIKLSNQSNDGICFKCNPVKNPNRTIRRSSLGAGGQQIETSMNMLQLLGTIHSMQLNTPTDSTKIQSRRRSSFGPLSIGTVRRSSVGSGSDTSLTSNGNHKELSARDHSEKERKAGIVLSSRSKSPVAGALKKSRNPKRSTRILIPQRGVSDHTMLVAAAAARRSKVPLRRTASNDLDAPLSSDDDQPKVTKTDGMLLTRSTSSGGVGPMKEEIKTVNSEASEVWDDFAKFAAKLKNRDGGKIGNDGEKKKVKSVDSDGFFDQSLDAIDAGFHSSFLDMGIAVAATAKSAGILSKDDEEPDEPEDDVLSSGTSTPSEVATTQQKKEILRCASPIVVTEAPLKGGEDQMTQQQSSEPSPDDEVYDNSDERIDLLQGTLSTLVQITKDRFDTLEQQIATVLQQQTLLLQQHAAILKLVTSTPTSPAPALPPPTSPTKANPKTASPKPSPTSTSPTTTMTDGGATDVPISVAADFEDKCETSRSHVSATVPKIDLVSPLADTPGRRDFSPLADTPGGRDPATSSLKKSMMPSSRHLGDMTSEDSSLRSSSSPNGNANSASSAKSAHPTGQNQKSNGNINSLVPSQGSNSALMHSDAKDEQDPPNSQKSSGAADFELPLTDKSEILSTKNSSVTKRVGVGTDIADSHLDSTPQETPVLSECINPLSRPICETTQAALENGVPPLSINVAGDLSGESNQFDSNLQRNNKEISSGHDRDLPMSAKEISNGSYGDDYLINIDVQGNDKQVSRRGSERRSSRRSASEKAKKKEKKKEKKKKAIRRTSENLHEASGSVNTEESSA